MHLHQVLTGAVNPGDNCYSVGSVGDVPFTVSGVREPERERPGWFAGAETPCPGPTPPGEVARCWWGPTRAPFAAQFKGGRPRGM